MNVHTSIRLYAADLHYPRILQVHTADDVTPGVTYANGAVLIPNGTGIGVMVDKNRCTKVWTREFSN
jgi:L-alanine-DL-glutamate epimerase-like enolase superfamily enzyme